MARMEGHRLTTRPHAAALRPSCAGYSGFPIRAGVVSARPRAAHTATPLKARVASLTPAFAAGALSLPRRPARSLGATVLAWGFFKKLGLKKPAFLPDVGIKKRQTLLLRFYGAIDRRVFEELLSPDFIMVEEGAGGHPTRVFTRQDYIDLVCNRVSPAVPDFTWTAATDGVVDAEGYAIVEVEPSGHHTGAPLDLGPGLPPVPPTGGRFKLPVAVKRVRVEDGMIRDIRTVGGEEVGPLALYRAVGGGQRGEAVRRG